MEGHNTDGTGSAYIKDNEFILEKYPFALTDILKEGIPFLSHMPCNSHTIVHLRSSTHGKNTYANTHPFLTKNYCVIHNGVWNEHSLARAFLEKFIKIDGETDSQVAAETIEFIGPKKFFEVVDYGGVFLVLHKNGELYVIKTSGQLEFNYSKNKKVLISSELSYKDYPKSLIVMNGLYKFSKNGHFISYKPSETFNTNNQYDWLNKSKRSINVKVLPAKIPFHHQLPSYYENFVD